GAGGRSGKPRAPPGQRRASDAPRGCEALAYPPAPLPPDAPLVRSEPLPPLEDDLAVAARVTPAWMGIQFRQAPDAVRSAGNLTPGAATVLAVYDGSPARRAGLEAGGIVLGPRGRPFEERDEIREWTMLSRG